VKAAVDDAVKEGRRIANAPRPIVARGAAAVERTARRVKARADKK